MSYSWCDPHFAAFYARREEESVTERLLARLRVQRALELDPVDWSRESLRELDLVQRPHLRLL